MPLRSMCEQRLKLAKDFVNKFFRSRSGRPLSANALLLALAVVRLNAFQCYYLHSQTAIHAFGPSPRPALNQLHYYSCILPLLFPSRLQTQSRTSKPNFSASASREPPYQISFFFLSPIRVGAREGVFLLFAPGDWGVDCPPPPVATPSWRGVRERGMVIRKSYYVFLGCGRITSVVWWTTEARTSHLSELAFLCTFCAIFETCIPVSRYESRTRMNPQ
jgi:hypothetical protein